MADILKGSWNGADNIGYIPPVGMGGKQNMQEESRQSLPELEAVLDERRVLFSPCRKYAIIRVGGIVELRERMKGFPIEYWEDVSSQLIISKFSLLALFQCMEEMKEEYPKEWS